MFDFRPNLNFEEILKSIADLIARLQKLKEQEFKSFHEDVFLLSRLICTNKKQSKSIENFTSFVEWNIQVVDSKKRVVDTLKMKNKNAKQKAKNEFISSRSEFLNQAEKYYKLNLNLQVKKDDSILKKLTSIQKDIKSIKTKLEKA